MIEEIEHKPIEGNQQEMLSGIEDLDSYLANNDLLDLNKDSNAEENTPLLEDEKLEVIFEELLPITGSYTPEVKSRPATWSERQVRKISETAQLFFIDIPWSLSMWCVEKFLTSEFGESFRSLDNDEYITKDQGYEIPEYEAATEGLIHPDLKTKDEGFAIYNPAADSEKDQGFISPDLKTKDEGFDVHDTDKLQILFKESQEHDDRKEWEVKNYDKVLEHDNFGKFYRDPNVEIEGKRVWWTKDNAEHGGSKWKLFVEEGKELVHYKDVDKYGKFMDGKHKSDVGIKIPKKQLNGK